MQGFHGVVKPAGDARPAWKVLRVLGNLLGLPGFEQDSAEQVKAEALGDLATVASRLNNTPAAAIGTVVAAAAGTERVADVPIYSADALVRRAPSLQLTADAKPPVASLGSALWQQLALREGDRVCLTQGDAMAVLPARLDATLAANTVRVPAGHADTLGLGAMFGAIGVEKVQKP